MRKKRSLGVIPFTAVTYPALRRLVGLIGRKRVRIIVDDLASCRRITPQMVRGWHDVLPGREAKQALLGWLRLEVPQVVGEAFP